MTRFDARRFSTAGNAPVQEKRRSCNEDWLGHKKKHPRRPDGGAYAVCGQIRVMITRFDLSLSALRPGSYGGNDADGCGCRYNAWRCDWT